MNVYVTLNGIRIATCSTTPCVSLLKAFVNVQASVINYKTSSHIIKPIIVKLILSFEIVQGWLVRELDVNSAFVHDHLEEVVYMTQPSGFADQNYPRLGIYIHYVDCMQASKTLT